jgi:hypothetical protein
MIATGRFAEQELLEMITTPLSDEEKQQQEIPVEAFIRFCHIIKVFFTNYRQIAS